MKTIKLVQKSNLPENAWFKEIGFEAAEGDVCLAPEGIWYAGVEDSLGTWALAHLPEKLPRGEYQITEELENPTALLLGWELGRYRYGKPKYNKTLKLQGADSEKVSIITTAIYRARDLVNSPPNIIDPSSLADEIMQVAENYNADVNIITGEYLLSENFPLVHAVGRASNIVPRIVDFHWGEKQYPKVTLVGKGVTFDSGGLDKKTASGMRFMKKDMGGAAQTLALAECIMALNLPVQLRVLIPCVENSISSNAFRVSDVIEARNGTKVEIGNTDAEGRLILADALTAATEEEPAIIIDCATLTGAARVAVGTDIAALFTNKTSYATEMMAISERWQDPVWPLPLYEGYRKNLQTPTGSADISSTGKDSYAGASTAALFLEHFVDGIPWIHMDFMAWRLAALPGRPYGGDVMGLLTLLSFIEDQKF